MLSDQEPQRTAKVRVREQLLTLEETANYLRLTPGALYTQRYRREKPGALGIRIGRRVLFRLSDIDRFLDEQCGDVDLPASQPIQ